MTHQEKISAANDEINHASQLFYDAEIRIKEAENRIKAATNELHEALKAKQKAHKDRVYAIKEHDRAHIKLHELEDLCAFELGLG